MSQSQSQSLSTLAAGDSLLSRYADCMFWMSRYLERMENLACLLEVTHSFSPASENAQNWQSVLALQDDEAAFAQRYLKLSAANVIRFYLADDSHENSILFCIQAARLNASQLRPVLSTEMWVQLNKMYHALQGRVQLPVTPEDLSGVLNTIRARAQTLAGIAEGGLYRDQGWLFYQLGRQLERADQTTRLLDIKYHLLLPSVEAVGSIVDAAQWFALLRAASAYHAFRREYPYVITPSTVAGFLLLDRRFPRSIAACIDHVGLALDKLEQRYGLLQVQPIAAMNRQLQEQLHHQSIEAIIQDGLHEALDRLQLRFIEMTSEISARFF